MTREELIEQQREEIKALKAANLALQVHFDTMKAELEEVKLSIPIAECTNDDTWNCKYCRKTENCGALKDDRNFGEPVRKVNYLVSIDEVLENDWVRK